MDRTAAFLILTLISLATLLLALALLASSPIFSFLTLLLLYSLYLFLANEKAGVHNAQEFENRFWTVLALAFSSVVAFAKDSPLAVGVYSPSLGVLFVLFSGYTIHAYDRYLHRANISRTPMLRRSSSSAHKLASGGDGVPVENLLAEINHALSCIDQIVIPSTINNMINESYIMNKERDILNVLSEADPKALNFLITRVKLGLLFYKMKDHRSYQGQHRTELCELLAVTRIAELNVVSRATVLDALQMMKMTANSRSEAWVKNLLLKTSQDDLSELKTLTDAKGDYFSMHKLIFDDIRSDIVKSSILTHFAKEARVMAAHVLLRTKKAKERGEKAWRKILSDVDDTLSCSGGSYPAGIDKRYGKKVIYPGVLSFYRELDLGVNGPEKWPQNSVGNLVFLSARPHVYKDHSERRNYAKFAKLRERGMHTNPSLLSGDMSSGSEYMFKKDLEPMSLKKFQNFKEYISIYPEFKHVFVGDNGQGDVRGAELMHIHAPSKLEAVYVHRVQPLHNTHGYDPDKWRENGLQEKICFFENYVEAGLHAARNSRIRLEGLRRICYEAVDDFEKITKKQWSSKVQMMLARQNLNQSIWVSNLYLVKNKREPCPLVRAEPLFFDNERVTTPYGNGRIKSFDPIFNLYRIELDWRPLSEQVADYERNTTNRNTAIPTTTLTSAASNSNISGSTERLGLDPVLELSPPPEDDMESMISLISSIGDDEASLLSSLEASREANRQDGDIIGHSRYRQNRKIEIEEDSFFHAGAIDEANIDRNIRFFLDNAAARERQQQASPALTSTGCASPNSRKSRTTNLRNNIGRPISPARLSPRQSPRFTGSGINNSEFQVRGGSLVWCCWCSWFWFGWLGGVLGLVSPTVLSLISRFCMYVVCAKSYLSFSPVLIAE